MHFLVVSVVVLLSVQVYAEKVDVLKLIKELQAEMREMRKVRQQTIPPQSHLAAKWLQRTVAGIRKEMREIAASVNTSAVLADQQRSLTNFALLRSDVVALGHRVDTVRVDHEKSAVILRQLRQDVEEMRQRLQESAIGQQKLLLEMDSLKDELREQILLSKKKNLMSSFQSEHLSRDSQNPNAEQNPKFRHTHWKVEVKHLQESVNNLEYTQTDISKQLQVIMNHQAAQILKLNAVEKKLNRSEQLDVDQQMTNQRLDVLESLVNTTEQHTLNIQSTSSGIQTLHGSTMQLFNALERLESNYDKTTDDLRKELSKLDSNLSQTQSDLEELRGSSLQMIRLNSSESQIQALSDDVNAEKIEIEALHRQVVEKAAAQDLSRWEKSQRKVRESILEFKEDLPRIKRHQKEMDHELKMLLSQLPRDCSSLKGHSGPYTIQSHSKASLVFCDMSTSGGPWTVIQRRSKGDISFDKDWSHYKNGFGDVTAGDFWIGNEMLHQMTTSGNYALRIDMWDVTGQYKYAEYRTFQVLAEQDNYRLVLAGYQGNASDAMSYHNGMAFSTPERDNDASLATHCADFYRSGWWYNHCQYVNINGRSNTGITWYDIQGQEWLELTKVEMKIKPVLPV